MISPQSSFSRDHYLVHHAQEHHLHGCNADQYQLQQPCSRSYTHLHAAATLLHTCWLYTAHGPIPLSKPTTLNLCASARISTSPWMLKLGMQRTMLQPVKLKT